MFVSLLKTKIGEKGPRYLPLVGGIGIFVFLRTSWERSPA